MDSGVKPKRKMSGNGLRLIFSDFLNIVHNHRYNDNRSHLKWCFMALADLKPVEVDGLMGLHQLGCHVNAEVIGLVLTQDEEDRGVALRLLEIGFLPGESVRVIAHGYPGHDPLAVRVGHTTFALRSHEAALVQVRVKSDNSGAHA